MVHICCPVSRGIPYSQIYIYCRDDIHKMRMSLYILHEDELFNSHSSFNIFSYEFITYEFMLKVYYWSSVPLGICLKLFKLYYKVKHSIFVYPIDESNRFPTEGTCMHKYAVKIN